MPRRPRRDSIENPYEKGSHVADMRLLAIESIRIFFNNKKYFCGGKIPESQLYSEHSIKTLLRTQLDDRCLSFLHDECLSHIPEDPNYKEDGTVTWQVHCLLNLLYELASYQLPKDYFGGLLLLYFKFCYGIKILDPPLI